MSKRSNALNQLSKEEYEDEINRETENDQESFQRADEAQLRTRRVVKTKFAAATNNNDQPLRDRKSNV